MMTRKSVSSKQKKSTEKASQGLSLKSIHSQQPSGIDLRKFLVNSSSFKKAYYDYLRVQDEELQKRKDFLLTVGVNDFDELNHSLLLYLDHAVSDPGNLSPINCFLHFAIHTIEQYYQEYLWESNRIDLKPEDIITYDNEPIIINKNLVTQYEHYILYLHYKIGVPLRQMAKDWDSPVENIHRKLSQIKDELKSHL